MDNFFLNNSTKELEEWMKTTQNPHYKGFFLYGDGKGHCWQGPESTAERLQADGDSHRQSQTRRNDDALVAVLVARPSEK